MNLHYEIANVTAGCPVPVDGVITSHIPVLRVSLAMRERLTGYGEVALPSHYEAAAFELPVQKRTFIEQYALTDPLRFGHFLEHLLPDNILFMAALDMAGWDLFARLRRIPLYHALGIPPPPAHAVIPLIAVSDPDIIQELLRQFPSVVYTLSAAGADEISDRLSMLRQYTTASIRLEAGGSLSFDEVVQLLPELEHTGIQYIEQPLPRGAQEAMTALRHRTSIPFYAGDSCISEADIQSCIACFDGVCIRPAACGGLSPALQLMRLAKQAGLDIMPGSMIGGAVSQYIRKQIAGMESTQGSASFAGG